MADLEVLILGAGPTGLGAAWCLDSHGQRDWLALEQLPTYGGLSRSIVDKAGYTWDIGGHVCFSHYDTFNEVLCSTLGPENCYEHERHAWIRHEHTWIPYPFQNNLHRLEGSARERCLSGLFAAAAAQAHGSDTPASFLEFIHATFGEGIAEEFMVPYNRKVWAHPLQSMSYRWIGERVSVPDPEQVARAARSGLDDVAWGPNNRFLFPKKGGTGAFWNAIAANLPQELLRTETRVIRIDAKNRTVFTEDGERIGYRHLVTTAPLDTLSRMLGDEDLIAATSQLAHNTMHVVGLGVDSAVTDRLGSWCWMYFPSARSPFYRVTNFSHYSPAHAPGCGGALMVEVAQPARMSLSSEELIGDVVRGLVAEGVLESADQVCHVWSHQAEHGYPIPTLGRDAIVDAALSSLEKDHIFSRGRFGAWRYEVGNMDHSFMQGYEVATRIMHGTPEVTLWNADMVNRHVATSWPVRG